MSKVVNGVTITDDMIKYAQESEKETGVPTSITLAQIALESGGSYQGGLSLLGAKYNNLFGIKANGWSGETVQLRNGVGDPNQYSTYRVYDSIKQSISDHAKVLLQDNYTKYTSKANTYMDYAKGIQSGGYAEDPKYADKLISIIQKNGLTSYDKPSLIKPGSIADKTIDKVIDSKTVILSSALKFVIIISTLILAVVLIYTSFKNSVDDSIMKGVVENVT